MKREKKKEDEDVKKKKKIGYKNGAVNKVV